MTDVLTCEAGYVCEKCGDFFFTAKISPNRKTLQCPYCGALAAFPCKTSEELDIAVEAVKMRNNISARINRMKGGDFS